MRKLLPISKRCLSWAVVLLVLGPVVSIYGPRILVNASEGLQPGHIFYPSVDLLNFVITLLQWTATPLGASLVAAAIVIQVLTPKDSAETDSPEE